jgi:FKBP-type peptidyl-prolyl cis-trans isomerase FklB
MNRSLICLAVISIASTGLAENKPQLKDLRDKMSYSIGLDIGNTYKEQSIDINPDALAAGLRDSMAGKEPALSKEERDKTLEAYQKEWIQRRTAQMNEQGEKNKAAGEKFLAENKKKEGVKTTASGLQYKVLKEGTGPSPKETDTVMVNYRGTLVDGTEFDSSTRHGGPATFTVNGVINGWVEALQMMKAGSKYQIFVPANLAYGDKPHSKDIGANATLIFELELISFKSPEAKLDAITTPVPNSTGKTSATPAKAVPIPTTSVSPKPTPTPTPRSTSTPTSTPTPTPLAK